MFGLRLSKFSKNVVADENSGEKGKHKTGYIKQDRELFAFRNDNGTYRTNRNTRDRSIIHSLQV